MFDGVGPISRWLGWKKLTITCVFFTIYTCFGFRAPFTASDYTTVTPVNSSYKMIQKDVHYETIASITSKFPVNTKHLFNICTMPTLYKGYTTILCLLGFNYITLFVILF